MPRGPQRRSTIINRLASLSQKKNSSGTVPSPPKELPVDIRRCPRAPRDRRAGHSSQARSRSCAPVGPASRCDLLRVDDFGRFHSDSSLIDARPLATPTRAGGHIAVLLRSSHGGDPSGQAAKRHSCGTAPCRTRRALHGDGGRAPCRRARPTPRRTRSRGSRSSRSDPGRDAARFELHRGSASHA